MTAPQLNVTVEPDTTVILDAGETPDAEAVNEEMFGVPLHVAGGGGGGSVNVGDGGGGGGEVGEGGDGGEVGAGGGGAVVAVGA
ncbi:MAG: hypothetical protein N2559_14855, partial [Anaerolineae bacterium]|nr:hypothetical protein [Anaerolineae bacterium]